MNQLNSSNSTVIKHEGDDNSGRSPGILLESLDFKSEIDMALINAFATKTGWEKTYNVLTNYILWNDDLFVEYRNNILLCNYLRAIVLKNFDLPTPWDRDSEEHHAFYKYINVSITINSFFEIENDIRTMYDIVKPCFMRTNAKIFGDDLCKLVYVRMNELIINWFAKKEDDAFENIHRVDKNDGEENWGNFYTLLNYRIHGDYEKRYKYLFHPSSRRECVTFVHCVKDSYIFDKQCLEIDNKKHTLLFLTQNSIDMILINAFASKIGWKKTYDMLLNHISVNKNLFGDHTDCILLCDYFRAIVLKYYNLSTPWDHNNDEHRTIEKYVKNKFPVKYFFEMENGLRKLYADDNTFLLDFVQVNNMHKAVCTRLKEMFVVWFSKKDEFDYQPTIHFDSGRENWGSFYKMLNYRTYKNYKIDEQHTFSPQNMTIIIFGQRSDDW